MWAGLRFINGYSPILPAGVAREFKFAIHGEIDWTMAKYLLEQQGERDGELARIGVDGIVVAPESALTPKPASEWEIGRSRTTKAASFIVTANHFARSSRSLIRGLTNSNRCDFANRRFTK